MAIPLLALLPTVLKFFGSGGSNGIKATELINVAGQALELMSPDNPLKAAAEDKMISTMVEWQQAASPSRVTRRYLATNIFKLYALLLIIYVGMAIGSCFAEASIATQLTLAISLIADIFGEVTTIVLMVFIFYFSSPMATKLIGNLGNKKDVTK